MAVSLLERQQTFGASGLAQMTRGNKVPNVPQNAGVPAALPLALSQLAGAVLYVPMSGNVPNVTGATNSGVSNDTIGSAFVSVFNGQPPYTYLTSFVSGSNFGINNATTTGPTFIRSGRPPAGSASGNFQTLVTDATGATITLPFTVTDNRV